MSITSEDFAAFGNVYLQIDTLLDQRIDVIAKSKGWSLGYVESWRIDCYGDGDDSIENASIEITYKERGCSCCPQPESTEYLSLSLLFDDDWIENLQQEDKVRKQEEARKKKQQELEYENLKEVKERSDFERLQKKFGKESSQ